MKRAGWCYYFLYGAQVTALQIELAKLGFFKEDMSSDDAFRVEIR
ncbi:hypothetical protein NXW89_19245 [Bacteroides thetaiotaomicron]|nr:hypothetical protein [Bacteroides thetaiotaomicron]